MGGPLAGVRVVELAGIGPGPFAAMMLADAGADVVRVERTTEVRRHPDGPHPDVVLRGRRSVAVDLKHPDGRQVRYLLCLRASVNGGDRHREDGQPAEHWNRGEHLHTFSSRTFGSSEREL